MSKKTCCCSIITIILSLILSLGIFLISFHQTQVISILNNPVLLFYTPTYTPTSSYTPTPSNTPTPEADEYDARFIEPADDHFNFVFKNEKHPDEKYVNFLKVSLEKNYNRLLPVFTISNPKKIIIEILTNREQFKKITGDSLDRGYAFRGLSYGYNLNNKLAFLIDPEEDHSIRFSSFLYLTAHELSHHFLFVKVKYDLDYFPLWVDEGFAEYHASTDEDFKIEFAFVRNSAINDHVDTLNKLTNIHESTDSKEDLTLAYSTSFLFTSHLLERYTENLFFAIANNLSKNSYNFNRTFKSVTGDDVNEVFSHWFQGSILDDATTLEQSDYMQTTSTKCRTNHKSSAEPATTTTENNCSPH